jgi:hypothetical protein
MSRAPSSKEGREHTPSQVLRDALRVGFLLCLPAAIAWFTGRPFIFPSLGPSAYSLVNDEEGKHSARTVIGGHVIGVAGGLLAYYLLADGFALSQIPVSRSWALLRLAASGILSVVVTTAGMLAARMQHPPACATTLIVSLGLLSTFWDAVFIIAAIAVMYGVHKIVPQKSRGDRTLAP